MNHKIAVIGTGYFGQRHLKILSQMEDVEIVGIADKDTNKAHQVASEFGLKYSENFRDLLDKAETFFIVTPTNTHFEIAMELIEAGKNIFIEKPLTENPEDASILLNKAISKGIIFQVGLIERFNPVINTLLDYIKSPIFINAQRLSPFLGRATDTDVTFDLMIHDLDLLWNLLKEKGSYELKDLKVFRKKLITDKFDFATVWLDIDVNNENLKANLTASRVSSDFQRCFSVIENDYVIHADLIKKTIIKIDKSGKTIELPIKDKEKQPLYEEIRDFLQSVKEKSLSKKAPTLIEILEVIKIINQINGGTT